MPSSPVAGLRPAIGWPIGRPLLVKRDASRNRPWLVAAWLSHPVAQVGHPVPLDDLRVVEQDRPSDIAAEAITLVILVASRSRAGPKSLSAWL